MFLKKVYELLLGLYPSEYRAEFGAEMMAVFEQAALERQRENKMRFLLSAGREIFGLIAGAARERISNRRVAEELKGPPVPADVHSLEKHVGRLSSRVIKAIANHEFAKARLYDQREREARALLDQLRNFSLNSTDGGERPSGSLVVSLTRNEESPVNLRPCIGR